MTSSESALRASEIKKALIEQIDRYEEELQVEEVGEVLEVKDGVARIWGLSSCVANEMLADFHYARDLAIASNSRVTICPSSNGLTCNGAGWEDGRIVFLDTDGSLTLNGAETVQRVTGDAGDVDVNTAEFGASITYRPNGRAMANIVRNNTGEFIVCDDRGSSHARALIVDMSGRPRVSHEDSSGLPPTCP